MATAAFELHQCSHWIFDMDGTLTVAVHDFEQIHAELGIPRDQPILEHLAAMDEAVAKPLYQQLDELEAYYASLATPQEGVSELLSALQGRGVPVAVLTRNSEALADITLEHSGLRQYFESEFIVGRESADPKPSRAGIDLIRERWGVPEAATAMIGDFRYDLEAARNAGCHGVYFDPQGDAAWTHLADTSVSSHHELLQLALPR